MKKVLLMAACVMLLTACHCSENGRHDCSDVSECREGVRCDENSTDDCYECDSHRNHNRHCDDRRHHRHVNRCNDNRHNAGDCVHNSYCENECETERCR